MYIKNQQIFHKKINFEYNSHILKCLFPKCLSYLIQHI